MQNFNALNFDLKTSIQNFNALNFDLKTSMLNFNALNFHLKLQCIELSHWTFILHWSFTLNFHFETSMHWTFEIELLVIKLQCIELWTLNFSQQFEVSTLILFLCMFKPLNFQGALWKQPHICTAPFCLVWNQTRPSKSYAMIQIVSWKDCVFDCAVIAFCSHKP